MIPANHQPWLDPLLYLYLRSLWRKGFDGIYLRGSEHLAALPADRPVLAYANHNNWWDLLMVYRLTREIPHKRFHGMMEEKQLQSYRFFSWLGAFSVDLSGSGRAASGLRYAVKLLKNPKTLIWIFPQGEICSAYSPFFLRPGLEFLIKKAPQSMVIPFAFRYEFFRNDRPVMLVEASAPFPATGLVDDLLRSRCEELGERLLQVAKTQDLSGFKCLEPRRLTINKRWEYILHALTGRLHMFNPKN